MKRIEWQDQLITKAREIHRVEQEMARAEGRCRSASRAG